MRLLCVPVAAFFLLTAAAPRRASRQYLQRVLGRRAGLRDVFRHFYTFALVSCDRLFFLGGGADKLQLALHGEEIILQHAARRRGCVLLVSHVGSFDAMRVPAIERESIPLRILIDKQHNAAATRVIEALNPQLAEAAIDAGMDGPQLALILGEALGRGEMVGIMADRASPGEALLQTAFLGREAGFPTGPWALALALKAPVVLCFAVYEGANRYTVHFRQVLDAATVPRRERRAALERGIASYVDELESVVRASPYNWFNFYDFWLHETTGDH